MRELPKTYDPVEVEARLAAWWEERGVFHAEPDDDGEPWSLVIPPPNVTGSLHVGHGLDMTVQDCLVRRARMQGRNAVLLPGMDHAGIATQAVVERQLAAEGTSSRELGREAFVDRVWAWREQSGGAILRQLRRLGYSADWEREAFTFDEQRSHAVREVFCTLYEQGLIYRGQRLINWSPAARTALSDIEVEHRDEDGTLTYIRYPGSDSAHAGSGSPAHPGVVVATTRPETMLGDTGVAVHPDDERYAHLVGSTVRLPLMDRDIPVVADEHVDPAFGTGAVKVTPAHDPNDWEIGQRHDLPAIDVMTDDAAINANGGPYEGLDRFEARRRVVEDLQALGLVERVEQRVHSVGYSSRTGEIVEPRLSMQWFVAVRDLADPAADAVRDGRTRFVPERNAKGFLDWLDNLRDWCISRQIWWGHRIPAWYDRDGEIHVYREDPSAAEVERLGLVQDPDVLDTWFSSQLWPFTLLGWPDRTPELARWYPTSVLVTGYDINTFWVSRMLMAGLHLLGEVPFRVVFNHGLVRDRYGKKMSKSFGNVIDPLDLIDRHGADALRFALLRAATPGQDVPLAEEWVEGARRFVTKLWNASRLVLGRMAATPGPARAVPADADLADEDRWILSRLEATRAAADEAFDEYDLGRAARVLYHFVWDEFCDWYLELAKLREDEAAPAVLAHVLDTALRLLHPVMPFVTEELWRTLSDADDATSLARAPWPVPAPERVDVAADARMVALQDTVTALRRFRADHGLPPATPIEVAAVASDGHRAVLTDAGEALRRLAGVRSWTFVDAQPAGPVGKVVVPGAELYVPLGGLVDLDEERGRLAKELAKAESEVTRAERKLGNAGFVAKASPEVVQAERDKRERWASTVATLRAQVELLG